MNKENTVFHRCAVAANAKPSDLTKTSMCRLWRNGHLRLNLVKTIVNLLCS